MAMARSCNLRLKPKYCGASFILAIALLLNLSLSQAFAQCSYTAGDPNDPDFEPPKYLFAASIGFDAPNVPINISCQGDTVSLNASDSFAANGTATLSLSVNENTLSSHATVSQNGVLQPGEPSGASIHVQIYAYALDSLVGSEYAISGQGVESVEGFGSSSNINPQAGNTDLQTCGSNCTGQVVPISEASNTRFGSISLSYAGRTYIRVREFVTFAIAGITPATIFNQDPQYAYADHEMEANLSAFGEDRVNDGKRECSPSGEAPANSPQSDHPVHIETGNKYEAMTDYESAGEEPLRLERSYNSRQSDYDRPFGKGTTHNFFLVIQEVRNEKVILAHRGDGSVVLFERISGNYVPRYGERMTFGFSNSGNWLLVDEHNNREEYQYGTGRLLFIESRFGHRQTMSYNGNGTLSSVTDSNGRTLTFSYDGQNRITEVTTPDTETIRYTYGGNGALEYVAYPDETPGNTFDNPTIEYLFEDTQFPTALTGVVDERGLRTKTIVYEEIPLAEQRFYDYAPKRVVVSELGGGAERLEFSYLGGATSVTNAEGKVSNFTFRRQEEQVQVLDIEGEESISGACLGANEKYTYDARGFVATVTDKEGNVTEYNNNSRGLPTTVRAGLRWLNDIHGGTLITTPETRTTTNTWSTTNRILISQSKPGLSSTKTFYPNLRVASETLTDTTSNSSPYSTNGQTRVTSNSFTYQPNGVTLASEIVNGPRTDVSDVTTRTFDAQGNLRFITNALGHTVEFNDYDGNGRPGEVTDENGVVTNMTYHPRGWLRTVTLHEPGVGSHTTEFTYHANGLLHRTILPNSSYLEYEYNGANHLTAVIAGEFDGTFNPIQRIDYTPNPLTGEWAVAETKDELGVLFRTQTRTFDELGRLKNVLGTHSQNTKYNYNRNDLLSSTNEIGATTLTTIQSYDALNRLVSTVDAILGVTTFGYDLQDNLTSVTDARGNTTTYVYDGFGNVIEESSPDAGTVVMYYDKADNLIRTIDARGVEKLQNYDALDRVLGVTYPANSTLNQTFTYDTGTLPNEYLVGRLSTVTDESGSTTYGYDARGNVARMREVNGPLILLTTYEYNAINQLASITYPSGSSVDYAYDALGRPLDVTSGASPIVSSLTYLPFGPVKALTFGNGLTRELNFDTDYRVLDIALKDGASSLKTWSYGFDLFDNITTIDDLSDITRSQSFFYDELHRLTDALGSYGAFQYDYDSVGNRLTEVLTLGATSTIRNYTYSAPGLGNRLLEIDDGATTRLFQYDPAGNLTLDGKGITLSFDESNRLRGVTP